VRTSEGSERGKERRKSGSRENEGEDDEEKEEEEEECEVCRECRTCPLEEEEEEEEGPATLAELLVVGASGRGAGDVRKSCGSLRCGARDWLWVRVVEEEMARRGG
jgi:hypothetical protein